MLVQDPFIDEHSKLIASALPTVAIQRSFIALSVLEKQRQGLTWSTLDQKVLNYQVAYAYVMLLFVFISCSAVGIYFTQVLPRTAGGFREHPCFCIRIVNCRCTCTGGKKTNKVDRKDKNVVGSKPSNRASIQSSAKKRIKENLDLENISIRLKDISNFERVNRVKYAK